MSKTKHTPGPWHVRSEVRCGSLKLSICTEDGGWLAELHRPGAPNEEEYAANARLIAASPALLTALEALLGNMAGARGLDSPRCPDQKYIEAALAALAKARGEGGEPR